MGILHEWLVRATHTALQEGSAALTLAHLEQRALSDAPRPTELALMWEQQGYHSSNGHTSEFDSDTSMNILFLDNHASWHSLAESTTAQYGGTPNLHILFQADNAPDTSLYGVDFGGS